ncbi:hypothetical protein BH11PSE9_BH11PSE9_20170 [soil metagenome]
MPAADWPASVISPCGMGDPRNLLMALSLTGCGGWSDGLLQNPPDERKNSPILPWDSAEALDRQIRSLGLVRP